MNLNRLFSNKKFYKKGKSENPNFLKKYFSNILNNKRINLSYFLKKNPKRNASRKELPIKN